MYFLGWFFFQHLKIASIKTFVLFLTTEVAFGGNSSTANTTNTQPKIPHNNNLNANVCA